MLTVIDENGKFTGVQYEQVKPNILKHHQKYGHKLVWIDRKLERDEEGEVTEEPTQEDLENEVKEAHTIKDIAGWQELQDEELEAIIEALEEE